MKSSIMDADRDAVHFTIIKSSGYNRTCPILAVIHLRVFQ